MTILSQGAVEIYLLDRSEGTKPTPDAASTRTYQRHWTPVHLDFGVDDVDAIADRIEAHGGAIEGKETGEWGAIAFCVDPFGHGFCIIKE